MKCEILQHRINLTQSGTGFTTPEIILKTRVVQHTGATAVLHNPALLILSR